MKKFYLLLFVVIISFSSCYEAEISEPRIVRYEVECTPAEFDITYSNSSENTEQKTISSGSWETSFTGSMGNFVYISAQSHNENANVKVKIYYKDKLIEEANSSGDYVIATASGSLP